MSFGGAGQGNVRYSIILDDTQAIQKLTQLKAALAGITQPSQAVAQSMGALNTNFASIGAGLTKTNTGFTQTGVAGKTLATNLTGVNTGFATLGTGINGLVTPTRTITTNMGALSNNFKTLTTTETQLVTQTNAFKAGMTALTAPTTTVNTNMKGLVGTMGPLAGNFQKTTGAAKDMVVEQKNLATGATSLGSKIKDGTSKFAGFATGMATVVTGVIGLVRNIRDLEDTQIAVDKANRKLSVSQEAVDKFTVKLAADTKKYGANSKEVKQTTLDLSQATQKLSIDTKLHGEAVERQNDNLQDVATSGFTTLLGVTTTAISGTRDLGLSLISAKPKIKEFGGSIKTMGANLLGTSGGFKSVIGNLGAIGFGVIGAVGLFEQFNKTMDILKNVSTGAIKPVEGIKNQLAEMQKLNFSSIEQAIISIAKLAGGSAAAADLLEKIGKADLEKLSKPTTELSIAVDKLAASKAKLKALEAERQTTGVQDLIKEQKATVALDQAEVNRLQTLEKTGAALTKLNSTASQSTNTWALQSKSFEGNATSVNMATNSYVQITKAIIDNNPALKKNYEQMLLNKQLQDAMTTALKMTGAQLLAYNNTLKPSGNFTQLFGDKTKTLSETQADLKEKLDATNIGMTGLQAAFFKGNADFLAFLDTTKNAAITADVYKKRLESWVGAQIQIPPALNLTTSQLEAMQVGLQKAELGMDGMSEATKILADAMNAQLAPALKTFSSAIGADKFKDFKKALKDIPGFGDFGKSAKKELTGLLNDFRKLGDVAAEVGTDISAGILGAFEGLSEKALGGVIKELGKDVKDFAKIDIDAQKFKPITDFLNTAPNKAAAFKQLNGTLALMQDAMAEGGVSAEEAASVMAKFAEETGKAGTQAGTATGKFGEFNKEALQVKVTAQVATFASNAWGQASASMVESYGAATSFITNTKPVVKVNIEEALGLMGELKRGWDRVSSQIEKKIPKINANTDKALDMIGELKRAWDKVASQIEKKVPKLKVNADQALDMIGEVTRGLNKIKDKTVTVRINTVGATEHAQHGMHKTLMHDTMIQAHSGERVDIGPTKGGGQSHSWSGGGGGGMGGDLIVNNVIDMGNDRIIRSFKSKLGTNRYRFGGG